MLSSNKRKTINLALQGGGSHGAFTWGVLDRLLEDERLEIEGISGASSGAINAAIFAYGMANNGRDGAKSALRNFWERLAGDFSDIFQVPLYMPALNIFNQTESPVMDSYLSLTQTFSPYQLNPLDMNLLRDLVAECIEFDYLRNHCPIKLFIAATQVRTGKLKIFENKELSIDTLMASACVPSIHHAVKIQGEDYWDGGFSGNPPVFPLIFNCKHTDIIIVMLHPLERLHTPVTAKEIQARASELSFSTAFLREMRAIAFSKKYIESDWMPSGHLEDRMKKINIHLIEDQVLSSQYNSRSRYNILPSFINMFYNEGYATAEVWLDNNFDILGKHSSVDLATLFC